MMKKIVLLLPLLALLSLAATAQKKYKPWSEWSDKDAQKMLNDSPWGQTQTETNTSEMFFAPSSRPTGREQSTTNNNGSITSGNDRNSQGSLNQAVNVNYRIRFLSAKPIRQAFARRLILQNPQAEAQLKAFAEQTSDEWVVVAVDYDAGDQRLSGKVMQAFNSAVSSTLKNNTYLETKDGKRIFLQDYKPPIKDGLGAKFVFARLLDGKPFVDAESGYLRFYAEVAADLKLNMRFKVSDMIFDGKFEY
jgi:hypothetical protein